MAKAIKKVFAKIRMVNLDSLVWDDEEYEIEEFLEKFSLPQIVMVREGQYERTDEKTMAAGQILKLHTVQKSEKVFGETSKGEEICIPLRCAHQLEIIPDNCYKVEYETLEDLFNLSPKYIRALDTLERPQIKKGTIFELKGKILLSSIWYVELKNTVKPYNRVQVPLLMKARFQPLADLSSYFLVEALRKYSFPFQVKFLNNTEVVDGCQNDFVTEENSLNLPSLGLITLRDREEESTLISTSRNGRSVTVVTFPTYLSILFSPALGLIKGDSTYARICRDFHDGVDLEKIKNRGQQKAYLSKNAMQQVDLDYEEIPPVVPPRDDSPQPEVKEYSDNSDSNEWSDSEEEDQQTPSTSEGLINAGQTHFYLDSANNNSSQLPPPRLPKPMKAMASPGTTTNPQLERKKPPPIKPKPSIKLTEKKDSVVLSPREIESIKQKRNIVNPYNLADEQNSPTSPRDKAATEDSGIGLEPSDGAPIPPIRDSSLHHEHEESEEEEVQNFGEGRAVGNDYDYEKSSNGNECCTSTSTSSAEFSEDSRHDYIYIDSQEELPQPNAKMVSPSSPPAVSRLSRFFQTFPGSRRRDNALTSLEDLRRVVNENLIKSLTINQVSDCLKLLHLSDYRKEFKKKQIDGSLFASLTEKHLVELGVRNVTDRTKILKLVYEGWVPR